MFRAPAASVGVTDPIREGELSNAGRSLAADAEAARAAAFEQLVQARLDDTYRLARLILRDAQEAEDATHDAFIRAWQEHGRLRDPDKFDAWFSRILVNACRDRLRRRKVRQHDGLDRASEAPSTDDAHLGVDDRDAIGRAFAALSPDHRIAVVLRYYRDLQVEEVARVLGVPVGTARSRIHYALRHLRMVLGDEGGFG